MGICGMEWNNVTITGRHAIIKNTLWLAMSGAGISFEFGPGPCKITLTGDDTATDAQRTMHRASYAIYVDDEQFTRGIMNAREVCIEIPGRERGMTKARIVKLSECTSSLMGISGVYAECIRPVEINGLKIEVIGDSITCGYGVEGNETQAFTTATENAEKSYSMLIGGMLNADVRTDCFSGFGIVSGYTDNGVINDGCLVPLYYEKTGMNGFVLPDGRRVQDIPWNFEQFQPEIIVLNLGTNDLSWCRDDEEKKKRFRGLYTDFLKMIRKNNRDAVILCVLGIMGTGLNQSMERAVADYKKENGDCRVYTLLTDEQDGKANGWGTDFHPSEITQRQLASAVAEKIRSILKEKNNM